MINREATIRWKGYDPDDLKPNSNKRVWANCDMCGIGRWVIYHQSDCLCISCGNTGENNAMYGVHMFGKDNGHWKGGKIVVACDNCGSEINRFPSHGEGYNFCNNECHNEWMAKNQRNENNPNWRGGLSDWRDYSKAIYLNDSFTGCHRHHITETIVACIPAELHTHIWHDLKNGINMGAMNMMALQYINGYYDEVV